MTKKDYELIAYCIFTTNISVFTKDENAAKLLRTRFAEWFADNLAGRNPRFDREKFLKACGLSVSKLTTTECPYHAGYYLREDGQCSTEAHTLTQASDNITVCARCGLERTKGTQEQTRDFVFADMCIKCYTKENQ